MQEHQFPLAPASFHNPFYVKGIDDIRERPNDAQNPCLIGAALLIAVQSAGAADDRGSLQGVVSDTAGRPVAGAFVKLRNSERRLTFMVISQAEGRFEANDLPAGRYVAQGVGGDYQSPVSAPVGVAATGSATINLSLSDERGPRLPPAWPHKLPEAQIPGMSLELPDGDGKDLVMEKCRSCHTLQRIMVQRADRADWDHSVAAMRARMGLANVPDLTDAEADKNRELSRRAFRAGAALRSQQPAADRAAHGRGAALSHGGLRSRRPLFGAARRRRRSAWRSPRWASATATRSAASIPARSNSPKSTMPPGPAAPDRAEPRQSADRRQRHPVGQRRPQHALAELRHQDRQIPRLRLAERSRQCRRQQHGAASERHGLGDRLATKCGCSIRRPREFKFYEAPSVKAGKRPGSYGVAVAGDGSVWWAEPLIDIDGAGRSGDRQDRGVRNSRSGEVLSAADEQRCQRRHLGRATGMSGKLMKIDHKTKAMTLYEPPTQNVRALFGDCRQDEPSTSGRANIRST